MKDLILPKNITSGIFNSAIAMKNVSVSKSRKTTMFEIELPIEQGGISYIDSEKFPIYTGMIICVKPGQIRHTKFPFKCYYIHIDLNNSYLADMLKKTATFTKIDDYNKYLGLFKQIYKYFCSSTESDKIIMQSLILKLIYLLISDSEKMSISSVIKNKNFEAIEKSKKYIKENITSNLSLNKISLVAGYSPIHFHNFFKTATGKTLHEYVEDERIKMAITMLYETNKTLSQIAYDCGFSSQSYFSYVFKRKMRTTPRKYVKELFEKYKI